MKSLICFLLCNLFFMSLHTKDFLWVEGESSGDHTFVKHNWYDKVQKDVLSGKDWKSHYHKNKSGKINYSITIKEEGEYVLWLRCIVLLSSMSYQLDKGPLVKIDLKSDTRGRIRLSKKPDHRDLAWVKISGIELKKGKHVISFISNSKLSNHGGIDCFCLINFPWSPSGVTKPSLKVKSNANSNDWFPVAMDDDVFSDESIIDMSSLIPKPAGKFGYVQRKGSAFQFSKTDQKIKFWGINASPAKTLKLQKQQARFYTKHGINMLRVHTVQDQLGLLIKSNGKRILDSNKLDSFDRWFSILKEEGIYLTFSFFYPHLLSKDDIYPKELRDELESKRHGKSTSGFVLFMDQLQRAERDWLEVFLNHKNPYTGLKYINDPALAVVEIRNEDSIFWHYPLNPLAAGKKYPLHTKYLKGLWLEWLRKKYLNNMNLKKAWGAGFRKGDSLENQKLKIYAAWEMEGTGPKLNKNEKHRMGDFIHFLAELQKTSYRKRKEWFRNSGFKGAVVSTAWRAGGAAADPANLWTDDEMDAIDRHNYFGGGAGGHHIKVGKFNNNTHLSHVGSGILSTGLYQVEDKPFIFTEWTQLPPNQFKAEISSLFAFYGMGLQGWDASYHFGGGKARMGSGWPDHRSYVSETPHYIGQFPAIAFALYKNHFKEGDLVAARRILEKDLFKGVDPLGQDFTGGGHDQKKIRGKLNTPLEALAIGRVSFKASQNKRPSIQKTLNTYWDKSKKLVKSNTGQHEWDYQNKVVKFKSSKTQGLVGFLGNKKYVLPALSIETKNDFAVILFTPLDDLDLIESKHILITCMGQDKQTGTKYNLDKLLLENVGQAPLLMEPVKASIELKGTGIKSFKAVDFYGVPLNTELEVKEGRQIKISGRHKTYYYEIRR